MEDEDEIKKDLEWINLSSNHGEYMSRARVPGGYLYKCTVDNHIHTLEQGIIAHGYISSITFVPDIKELPI